MGYAAIYRRGRLRFGRAVIVLGLSVLMLFAFATPASAQGRMTISGDSVPSDCNNGKGAGAIEMTGDLEGCLTFFPEGFKCKELNGFARYREWGTERFIGTLHGDKGRFRTTYTLEATYESGSCAKFEAGKFPFRKQLTGGCEHKIIGKRGVFKDAKGLITFFDVIPNPGKSGASNYLYAGHVTLAT